MGGWVVAKSNLCQSQLQRHFEIEQHKKKFETCEKKTNIISGDKTTYPRDAVCVSRQLLEHPLGLQIVDVDGAIV